MGNAKHQFCQHHRNTYIVYSEYHGDLNMLALWQLLFDVSPAYNRLETEWNKKGPILVILISFLCCCLHPLCSVRWCAKSHFHLQDNKQAALYGEHWAKVSIFGHSSGYYK